MPVTRPDEIYLFDNFYPIVGPVKVGEQSPFANKTVFGDFSKDSERHLSSLVFNDHRLGIGIKDMVETKDMGRCYWSTCNLDNKAHLLLPSLATDCTNPTATATDGAILIEYSSLTHCAFGTDLRRWIEGTSAWSTSLGTLVDTPTDVIVHKSKLYFACGSDFNRWDGTTLTTGTALSGGAILSRYMCEWDSKLFVLSNTGVLKYSTDEGVTWTTLVATGPLQAGLYTSLFVGLNTSDVLVIYLGSKTGVRALDYTNSKWIDPQLPYPKHDYGALGADRWRDSIYVPAGLGLYRMDVNSNAVVITPMGPDRDYGLPSDYAGNIIRVIGEHNAMYALLDATTEMSRTLYTANYVVDSVFYDNQGYSAVLKWNGAGWSVTWVSGAADGPIRHGCISSSDGQYRLWFAVDRTVYRMALNKNLQNPLEITGFPFGSTCTHIWPNFDADNAVVDKVAVKVNAYASGLSTTEYIKLYYSTDYGSSWTNLTSTTFTDGQIDVDGEAEFTFASGAGLSFKAIRFKAELYRGSTTTETPDLQWFRLSYIKKPDPEQLFSCIVDCSKDYRHKRASTLIANLKTAAETKTYGSFIYRTFRESSESFNVQILDMQGVTQAGRTKEGQYKVSLLAA